MTFTYASDPSASDVAAVRFEIQDTNAAAPLLQDAEIAWSIAAETQIVASTGGITLTDPQRFAAAARCLEVLVRQFTMQADTEVGGLKETFSAQAQSFAAQAAALRAKASGFAAPYAGGQSITEKIGFGQNPDAVQPKFSRDEFNNPFAGNWRDPGALPPSN